MCRTLEKTDIVAQLNAQNLGIIGNKNPHMRPPVPSGYQEAESSYYPPETAPRPYGGPAPYGGTAPYSGPSPYGGGYGAPPAYGGVPGPRFTAPRAPPGYQQPPYGGPYPGYPTYPPH